MESVKQSMNRSISMPVKPNYCEPNSLQRSNEKENLSSTEDEEEEEDELVDGQCAEHILDSLDDLLDKKETKFVHQIPRTYQRYASSTIEVDNDDDKHRSFGKRRNSKIRCSTKLSKRLVLKNGQHNVSIKNIPRKSIRFLKDVVTTVVEQSWSFIITLFTFVFVGSWFGFALIWYLISYSHGDFDPINIEKKMSGEHRPCVTGVYDLTSMFIHSLEVQTTIGFGEKFPTEECPEGVILFVVQIIASIGFEGAMIALIYSKMAKPIKKIYSKLTFSKTACLCLRDEKLCFVFRVCDEFEQRSIDTKIRAYFVMNLRTAEGENLKVHSELNLESNGRSMIMWPETVCHVIDSKSPMFNFTRDDFQKKQYEILISLVGHSQSTGQMTESLTSYFPHEIIWGQRFMNIVFYNYGRHTYVIDYENFHSTEEAQVTCQSAAQLEFENNFGSHDDFE